MMPGPTFVFDSRQVLSNGFNFGIRFLPALKQNSANLGPRSHGTFAFWAISKKRSFLHVPLVQKLVSRCSEARGHCPLQHTNPLRVRRPVKQRRSVCMRLNPIAKHGFAGFVCRGTILLHIQSLFQKYLTRCWPV